MLFAYYVQRMLLGKLLISFHQSTSHVTLDEREYGWTWDSRVIILNLILI